MSESILAVLDGELQKAVGNGRVTPRLAWSVLKSLLQEQPAEKGCLVATVRLGFCVARCQAYLDLALQAQRCASRLEFDALQGDETIWSADCQESALPLEVRSADFATWPDFVSAVETSPAFQMGLSYPYWSSRIVTKSGES